MKRLQTAALVGLYLAAVIAANQIIAAEGKAAVLYVGAGLVGLTIVTRDRLHDLFADYRVLKMGLLIFAGSAISYLINGNAATARIAEASAAAFAVSESLDAVAYWALHRRPWLERSNTSNVVSATADTLIFFQIAFGAIPVELAFAQIAAKVAGGYVYSVLLQRRRQPVAA